MENFFPYAIIFLIFAQISTTITIAIIMFKTNTAPPQEQTKIEFPSTITVKQPPDKDTQAYDAEIRRLVESYEKKLDKFREKKTEAQEMTEDYLTLERAAADLINDTLEGKEGTER